jgi:hypothetical protein
MTREKARVFRGNFVFSFLFALFFCLLSVDAARAEERWYISNAAGMALEPTFSRRALREKYALAVTEIPLGDVPSNLREFFYRIHLEAQIKPAKEETETETDAETADAAAAVNTPFSLTLEKRVLYKNREVSRLQWLFLDREKQIRLAAAFALDPADYPPPETGESAGVESPPNVKEAESAADVTEDGQGNAGTAAGEVTGAAAEDADAPPSDGEAAAPPEGEEASASDGEKSTVDYSGYIELYNPEGYIVEEHLFSSDSSDRMVNYFYQNQKLLRAVTRIYRPAGETGESSVEDYCTDYYRYSRSSSLRGVERVYHAEAESEPVRLRFPHVVLEAAKNTVFVSPGVSFTNEFLKDILVDPISRVLYTTDEKGRVLTETRRNEEGEVTGELQNTWSGDRLVSVRWKSGDDDRLTEFEYDSEGDRIVERNINRGVLERVVTREGDKEIEVLYIEGKPMLRAVWENGRKILEERIRPAAASGGGAGS